MGIEILFLIPAGYCLYKVGYCGGYADAHGEMAEKITQAAKERGE